MSDKDNILELLSDLFATAYDFKSFIEDAETEEVKKMLDILCFKVLYVNDFILDNIDIQELEQKS